VTLLSQHTPASVVFFDLLSEDCHDLRNEPFEFRRNRLELLLSSAKAPIHITPATREKTVAEGFAASRERVSRVSWPSWRPESMNQTSGSCSR
jgi:ATP-dependent DNA ligase